MDNLIMIPVENLDDHEKNPRVVLREDVVSGITAQIKLDGFKPQYALHVRKIGDRYQILSGHHRKQAAINAGIESVW
jgi:ParB-like chromosome segregation protein Spo0J